MEVGRLATTRLQNSIEKWSARPYFSGPISTDRSGDTDDLCKCNLVGVSKNQMNSVDVL